MENYKIKLELMCRTCLRKLQTTKYDIFITSHLSEWLSTCTSLQVEENDGLSKYLCDNCFMKIEEFHEFRKMCIESEQKYHQLCSNNSSNNNDMMMIMGINNVDDINMKEEILLELQVNTIENHHHQQNQELQKESEEISCSKIEEEVVNALANMVQNPGSPILQHQQQQHNDDVEDQEVLQVELNELCEDNEYSMDIGQIDTALREGLRNDANETTEQNLNNDCNYNCYDVTEDNVTEHNNDGDNNKNMSSDIDNNENCNNRRKRKRKKSKTKNEIFGRKTRSKRKISNNSYGDDDDENKTDSSAIDRKINHQEIFNCEICDRRYFKKEKFDACMRSHKGLKPWVCPECKKEYRKKTSLMNHIKFEHNKNCEMYACPVEGCDKTYRLKQTMQVHYRRIHAKDLIIIKDPKKIKSYICEQCGKSLRTLNALNQHRFIHTGDFPFKCEQCPKRCGTRYQLEVHLKRHKGIKNYVCSICGLKKITQQELNTHMNYHLRNKTFTCKFCPYTSCNNGNVVRHEKIVHHGIKTFECVYCGKTFGKAETLKHHVMTHTGEKPHECHLCGRRFIQPTALKTHLKRHDKGTIKSFTTKTKTDDNLINKNELKNDNLLMTSTGITIKLLGSTNDIINETNEIFDTSITQIKIE